MIPSAPLFHFPDAQLNRITPDIRHRPTWDVGIGDADIWLLETVVWRAPYFPVNGTAAMPAPPALHELNGTHVVDLVEIVLHGDAPSSTDDGKADS